MKRLYINDVLVEGTSFVFDGCHKIYVVEDIDDVWGINDLWGNDTKFYKLEDIENCYNDSCPLRFISNWKLDKDYVKQCEENVRFEWK